jgi:hypothetical protein
MSELNELAEDLSPSSVRSRSRTAPYQLRTQGSCRPRQCVPGLGHGQKPLPPIPGWCHNHSVEVKRTRAPATLGLYAPRLPGFWPGPNVPVPSCS